MRRRAVQKDQFVTLEATFTGRLGNVRSGTFSGTLFGAVRRERHIIFAQGTLDYAEFFGKPTVARAFAHTRYNYEFLPWLLGEVFFQAQADEYQRLRIRSLVGMGPRLVVLASDDVDVNVGTSAMFEHEVLNLPVTSSFPPDRQVLRWNNFLTASYRIGTQTEMVGTLYVQPRFADFGDVRMLGETSLQFKITSIVLARMSLVFRFQSRPPPDVLEGDLEVRNGLALSF